MGAAARAVARAVARERRHSAAGASSSPTVPQHDGAALVGELARPTTTTT
jgi:hypothetical protein